MSESDEDRSVASPPRSRINDPAYLRGDQYRTADNLRARIALHLRFSTNLHGWPAWVLQQLSGVLPPGADLLEVGAGSGHLWTATRSHVPRGWRVHLTDFSPGMLDAARKALGRDGRFSFEVADAVKLPVPDGSRHAVLAHHMLYHVPDRAVALREFCRVLRPGGLLSIALNGRVHMAELFEFARELPGLRTVVDRAPEEKFELEDAPPEVGQFCGGVETRRYDDALHITAAAPLADYYASDWHFVVDDRAALERALAERIARDGAIRIAKSSGLVFARKSATGVGN